MGFFRKSKEKIKSVTLKELGQGIDSAGMPSNVRRAADYELEKLSGMNPALAEYSTGITYINYLIRLPWNKKTGDNPDPGRVVRVLSEGHYGLSESSKEKVLEHLAGETSLETGSPRILIVDDEEMVRKHLDRFCKKENYIVTTTSNGRDAIKILNDSSFDIIITDLKMPGVSGMDVLEKAKKKNPDTQVIMITGFSSGKTALESLEKGVFRFITKPFKLEEVRSVISEALKKKMPYVASKGSVFCFTGPSGVGKAKLGKSIAEILGRKFSKISLEGIKDEAEIIGHRRTSAVVQAGCIIKEIQQAESTDPVLMLDGLDRTGKDFSSALLKVLEPGKNQNFIDHYLNVPFDLSNVIFIVTAGTADNIPRALREHLEVIDFRPA
jgi:ATP-dependent Lon protease